MTVQSKSYPSNSHVNRTLQWLEADWIEPDDDHRGLGVQLGQCVYLGQYSGTSINGHLIKAVTYCNVVSIAGPERPPYIHNIYSGLHIHVENVARSG